MKKHLFIVLLVVVLVSHSLASPHSDAVLTAQRIDSAIKTQSLPYDRTLDMNALRLIGYNTSLMIRPGEYTINIKSVSYNPSTGILTTYLEAWHEGIELKVNNPVHWYMPFSSGGGQTTTQRLNLFLQVLIAHLETLPYGRAVGDDTLVVYAYSGGRASEASTFTWQNIRDAPGDAVSANQSNHYLGRLRATTSSGNYNLMGRVIITFNTSSLTSGVNVTSGNVTVIYASDKKNGLGSFDIGITGCTPADETSIVAGDYDSFSGTELSDRMAYASFDGTEIFTLNAAGLSYVDKTGFTSFMFRDSWDIDNSFGGTWASSAENYVLVKGEAQATESNRPKLTLIYEVAPTPTPTTPTPTPTTPTPTPTAAPPGEIGVYSYGSAFVIWTVPNGSTVWIDGVAMDIPANITKIGIYDLLPNTKHTACYNQSCVMMTTRPDFMSSILSWGAYILMLVFILASYYIPVSAIPATVYGLYLLGVYLPDSGAGQGEYFLVGILLICGLIVGFIGFQRTGR